MHMGDSLPYPLADLRERIGFLRGDQLELGAVDAILAAAYRISFEQDEGRWPTFRFFLPRVGAPVVPRSLSVNEALNPLTLRQLWPAADFAERAFLVGFAGGELVIEGLVNVDDLPRDFSTASEAHEVDIQGLLLSVRGPGFLRAAIGRDVFAIRAGEVIDGARHLANTFLRRWTLALAEAAEPREVRRADRSLVCGLHDLRFLFERFIVRCVARISDRKHGGALVVLPKSQLASENDVVKIRFKALNSSIRTDVLDFYDANARVLELQMSHAAEEIVRDWKPTVDRWMLARKTAERSWDSLADLSATDGCVVLGEDLAVQGFRAVIQRAPEIEVQIFEPTPEGDDLRPVELSALGGTRHQSAAWLCGVVPGANAIVVSQDGAVTTFENHGHGEVWAKRGLLALTRSVDF